MQYLMNGIKHLFPSLPVEPQNCISTFAGIRPVLSKKNKPPSEESREHVVWVDNGLITITGGKLTTFRLLARDALTAAAPFLESFTPSPPEIPVFSSFATKKRYQTNLNSAAWRRLYGRYGSRTEKLVREAGNAKNLEPIPGTRTLWAELPFSARYEQIRHLDDLLLRRVRIGLLTEHGGKAYIPKIQALCEPVLPWTPKQWEIEIERYLQIWEKAHGLPSGG
jgi:glycerol-3-phosphate dehydrogenase